MIKTVEINGKTFEVTWYDNLTCYALANGGETFTITKSLFDTLFPAPKPAAADKWKRADEGGEYWYLDSQFNVITAADIYWHGDKKNHIVANYFATRATAELYRDKIVLMLQMQR